MFQARVRDSLGNRITMEFFHVPFRNADNQLCHLLGLREYADFKHDLSSKGGLHVIDEDDISMSSFAQSDRTSARFRLDEVGMDNSFGSLALSDQGTSADTYAK